MAAAECAVSWCGRQGIPVLKRCTGGGTVFHDLGNLNYAFIVPMIPYSIPGTCNMTHHLSENS